MKRIFVTICLLTISCQVQAAILLESSNGVLVSGPTTMATACTQTLPIHITSVLDAVHSNYSSASQHVCLAPINIHPVGSLGNTTTFRVGGPFTASSNRVLAGTGAVIFAQTTVPAILPEWWTTNSIPGTTDMTSAWQAAWKSSMASGGIPVSLAGGSTYLVNGTAIVGNTADTVGTPVSLNGNGATLKSTSPVSGLLTVQGPHPEVDGAGNRTGRVRINDVIITGPGSSGTGLLFYGVQGIVLDHVDINNWDTGIMFHNVDLVNIVNGSWLRINNKAIDSSNTGYAVGGQLNSFIIRDSYVVNNTVTGIDYHGGIAPQFINTNFVANGTSLLLSYTSENSAVTSMPRIEGCYFEADTGTMIYYGGLNGIVRGGTIDNNNFLVTPNTTAIIFGNISDTPVYTRAFDNSMSVSGGVGSFTPYDASTSVAKPDWRDGTSVDYTVTVGNANHGKRQTSTKVIGSASSADIISVGSFGVTTYGTLTIDARGSGTGTLSQYNLLMIGGGGVISPRTAALTQNYSGGVVTFTLTETTSSGTNKLTINNTSGSSATFIVTYEEFSNTATML